MGCCQDATNETNTEPGSQLGAQPIRPPPPRPFCSLRTSSTESTRSSIVLLTYASRKVQVGPRSTGETPTPTPAPSRERLNPIHGCLPPTQLLGTRESFGARALPSISQESGHFPPSPVMRPAPSPLTRTLRLTPRARSGARAPGSDRRPVPQALGGKRTRTTFSLSLIAPRGPRPRHARGGPRTRTRPPGSGHRDPRKPRFLPPGGSSRPPQLAGWAATEARCAPPLGPLPATPLSRPPLTSREAATPAPAPRRGEPPAPRPSKIPSPQGRAAAPSGRDKLRLRRHSSRVTELRNGSVCVRERARPRARAPAARPRAPQSRRAGSAPAGGARGVESLAPPPAESTWGRGSRRTGICGHARSRRLAPHVASRAVALTRVRGLRTWGRGSEGAGRAGQTRRAEVGACARARPAAELECLRRRPWSLGSVWSAETWACCPSRRRQNNGPAASCLRLTPDAAAS